MGGGGRGAVGGAQDRQVTLAQNSDLSTYWKNGGQCRLENWGCGEAFRKEV